MRPTSMEFNAITVDMGGVVFITNEAAFKLARLRSARLQLINCSGFIEMLLENAAKEIAAQEQNRVGESERKIQGDNYVDRFMDAR